MKKEGLDALLEQLSIADDEQVAKLYEEFAPFLQIVVRRLLPTSARRKLDSEDVVVSVWADVVQGLREDRWQFVDHVHFKAFLQTLARNRLYDHLRKNRHALEKEVQFDQPHAGDQPEPSALLQADDLWEKLLKVCPPQYEPCLQLRREGYTFSEIGSRTGFHPSSIRRIFYDLARQLAVSTQ